MPDKVFCLVKILQEVGVELVHSVVGQVHAHIINVLGRDSLERDCCKAS
jgi:hypothetical protein